MDIPLSDRELDAHTLYDLGNFEVGDTIWIPGSMIRGNKFRAYKITIEERASVNGFEEFNAVDKWKDDENTTIHGPAESHKESEGIE